jgi:glutamyl-tRNA reductase
MLHLVGLSHRTAPVEWRERLAVPEDRLADFLAHLRGAGATEVVVLSTCNRVEVYAVAEAERALREALLSLHGNPALDGALYASVGEAAVEHLFRVSSGLDSLVVGEAEILGQVKRAYDGALARGATGKLTNVLFQRAIYVGKKVRSSTRIAEGPTSVPSLAAALAGRIFGDLSDNRVLVVGAGAMAEQALRALASLKPGALTVVNRTLSRAEEIAAQFHGRAVPFDRLLDEVAAADVVLCSTGAPHPILTRDAVEPVVHGRRGRPLFFIDIAVPRDVDPSIHGLNEVYLYNIDDLQALVDESLERRRTEIDRAAELAASLARDFAPWYRAWSAGETATLVHAPREAVKP